MLASSGTELSTPTYMPAANRVARRIAERMNGIPQSAVAEVLLNTLLSGHILGGCKSALIQTAAKQ